MTMAEKVRHAYEVCAQIAAKHARCDGGTHEVEPFDHPFPCAVLIEEEIRNAQGSKNPSPRCGRTWESLDGMRVFTCPRKAKHAGGCGDNTNKRRNAGDWREVIR